MCNYISGLVAVRDLTARNAIEGRQRIYIFTFIYFLMFFSIEFFEGSVRIGGLRWSVDPVRWTGPRTGGQCFRSPRKKPYGPTRKAYGPATAAR